MARYSYKRVCFNVPPEYIERLEKTYDREFDGDPNYDGDYWTVVAWWIEDLQAENKSLKERIDAGKA